MLAVILISGKIQIPSNIKIIRFTVVKEGNYKNFITLSFQTEFNPTPAHLSLTVDEVIHIRTVLVKAELENLRVNPKLYQAVSAEKVKS